MSQVFDYPRLWLRRTLGELDSDELHLNAKEAVMQQVSSELAAAAVPIIEGILPGREAQRHLATFHDAAVAVATRFIAQRSGIEWLWYLRRAPQLFAFNRLRGTRIYCASIAEQLCATSPTQRAIPPDGRYSLEINDVYDLLYLRELVGLVYNVHSAIRWAGKGAPIRLSGNASPKAEPSLELRDSVRIYDERRDQVPPEVLAKMGLLLNAPEGDERNGELPLIVVGELEEVTPLSVPGNHELVFKSLEAGYQIGRLDLSVFNPLFCGPQTMGETLARQMACAVVGLVSLSHPTIFGSVGFSTSGVALANIMNVGYELTTLDEFHARCEWAIAALDSLGYPSWISDLAVSAEHVIEVLSSVPISIYPPRLGRAVWHALDNGVLINWSAMTRLLLESIERVGSGGAEANVWASTFEERVQAWVNLSGWSPPPELAQLRGRTLRRSGRSITDVDAIGERQGQLLLISCKSRALTEAFERGDYSEVRNARSDAEQALTSLRDAITNLRQEPIGDNFNFSEYQEIVGVVVYPFLPYVGPQWMGAEAIPGLPAIVSGPEFLKFLDIDPFTLGH